MKDKFIYAVDYLFIVLLTLCPLQCLTTAFNIKANTAIVILCVAMFTMVFTFLAVFEKSNKKYAVGLVVILIAYVLMVVLSIDVLSAQLNYAVNCVLREYAKFMGVPKNVKFALYIAKDATAPFVALALPVSGILTTLIMRVKVIIPACIIPIILIAPCFILVNTPPDTLPTITMFAVLFTMLLTSAIHRYNLPYSGAITCGVAVLVAMLAIAIYFFNPIEGYERYKWQDDLLELTRKAISYKENDNARMLAETAQNIKNEVDLSNAGPKEKNHKKVMTVTSPYAGEIYLKGIAYGNYENNKWSILTESQAEKYPVVKNNALAEDYSYNYNSFTMTYGYEVSNTTIDIVTEKSENILYTPYYLSEIPHNSTPVCDVLIKNDSNVKTYQVTLQPFSTQLYTVLGYDKLSPLSNPYNFSFDIDSKGLKYMRFVNENYLDVPQDIKEEMQKIASDLGITELDKKYKAEAVRKYISSSAKYSLKTEKVPQGKDISTWFLNESDTGYCVHFATSATLMLRSIGIPARYVTGYYAYVSMGKPEIVTTDNAHAWVEYFDEDIGWVPMEATPSDFITMLEDFDSTENTESSTTPTEATQATEPTQPTTATQPPTNAEPTNPTQVTIKPYYPNGNPAVQGNLLVTIINIIIAVIFIIILTLVILLIRRIIVLYLRKKSFENGSSNHRTKCIYRYLLMVSKYSYVPIPKEIVTMAEKARFSNSTIDHNELDTILQFTAEKQKAILTDVSKIKKLYYKYILVLA